MLVIGEKHMAKINQIALSNTAIQTNTEELGNYILTTVVSEIK